jgi:hypothetical protein
MSRAEHRKPKSSRRAGVLGGLGVLAVAGVVVVAVASGNSSGGGDGPAGAGGAPGATVPTGAVQEWYVGGGQQHLTTVGRDATGVSDDAAAGDTVSLGSDCATLLADVQAAQVYRPIPDAAAQQHWSRALDLFAQASADCADGTTGNDAALLASSRRELAAGSTELDAATGKVDALTAG